MLKSTTYKSKNLVLTSDTLNIYINQFWNDIYSNVIKKGDKHLMILCKVEYMDTSLGFRTLGHLRRVNFSDKELFFNYLSDRLGSLTDSYQSNSINKIIFTYIIRDGLADVSEQSLLQDLSDKALTFHKFNNMNLPASMIPTEYGNIISTEKLENFTKFIVSSHKRIFEIDVSLDTLINKVTILGFSNLKWTDTKLSDGGFKREIGKSTIYFLDGEIVLKKVELSPKPFKKLTKESSIITKFATIDIETIKNSDNQLVPYLICGYNGNNFITSYGLNQKTLFTNFISSLLTFFEGSKSLTVYAHNLSSFDGVFLMKHLLSFGKVEPLLHNGKLMSIKVKLTCKGYKGRTLIFKDSFLLLPLSLRNLCLAFNVSISKGYFPFGLSNIFYTGVFPQLKYWKVNLEIFNSLKTEHGMRIWSFKDEAIKYCKLDCQSLHELLVKFNELIFNKFSINIHSVLTLPSLAMRIYKTHFMPDNFISKLGGLVEQAIRESYTGGSVDVYKPHNWAPADVIKNLAARYIKLFYYDVNSLYPTVMSKCNMPVGKPIAFEGDIRKYESNAFGFFYCKITSPAFILHPILQRKIETAHGIRTIAGLGTWNGWIFSKEMDNAIKYGYTFEIIKGYEFKPGYIFKEYIDKMYELRLQYPKGEALNLIAKLLMNSLYGKFGMTNEISKVEILNKKELNKYLDKYNTNVIDIIYLEDHAIILHNTNKFKPTDEDVFHDDPFHATDTNVAIASAIAAYSRIFMSYAKNNPAFRLYYTDTDSWVTNAPLPPEMVGEELGQLKLEHVVSKAVFLAPKVYGLIDTDGNEIIKAKGLSKKAIENLKVSDLELLLRKDATRLFNQEKAFKSLYNASFEMLNTAYTLKATSNKRQLVYVNGIFDSTKPFKYEEITSHKKLSHIQDPEGLEEE